MNESKIGDTEIIISKALRVGVVFSAFIILTGLSMFLISGHSGYPGDSYPTTITEIINGLILFKPYAIISAGLLALILTPVFRVGVSIIVFLKEEDYLYVIITTVVFAILLTSFIIGKVG